MMNDANRSLARVIRRASIALIAVVAISAPRVVRGDSKIVLESFTGGKTEDNGKKLAPLLEALADRGFIGGYDALGRTFEARASRVAIDKGLPADLAAQVEAGHRAWLSGRFEDAIKLLVPLLDNAHANSGAFAKRPDDRMLLFKALVALALAQSRTGDPPAMRQTFGELVRSFPSDSLPRAIYGGDAAELYDKTRKELSTGPRGKLVVRSSFDGAIFFVNEKYAAAGTLTLDNLLPGEYRVFAQLGRDLSRTHRVLVRPNETTTVAIDAAFDLAVQVSPTWTGLAYSSAADRERYETAHAAEFANAVDAEAVAIVGIDIVRGKPAVIGALINRRTSSEMRRASVALDPPPADSRLKALAQFLAGDNLRPEGVEVLSISERPIAAPGSGPGRRDVPTEPVRTASPWRWVTGGIAAAALGSGIALLVLDGRCRDTPPPGRVCENVYQLAAPGYGLVGVGAAAAAVTVYLFLRQPSAPARRAFVSPTPGGAMVGLAVRF